jgi:hypothetical protein
VNIALEQRSFPRMAIDCAASYRLADAHETRDAKIKNISAGGMLFITGDELEIGATLELRVAPGQLSIPMLSAIVEVVRRAPVQNPGTVAHEGAYPGYEVGGRVVSIK